MARGERQRPGAGGTRSEGGGLRKAFTAEAEALVAALAWADEAACDQAKETLRAFKRAVSWLGERELQRFLWELDRVVKLQTTEGSPSAESAAVLTEAFQVFLAELKEPESTRLTAMLAKLAALPARSSSPEAAMALLPEEPSEERVVPQALPVAGTEVTKKTAAPVSAESQTIRIDKGKLDLLMDQMGELLITRGAFQHLSKWLSDEYGQAPVSREMRELSKNFAQVSRALQDTVMDLRLQEIRTVFQRFPRVVRDISQQHGKQIRLELCGEDTKLDKTVIERIGDPLMHLVRNAADHGIELPEERLLAGKAEEGTITLKADQRGTRILLRIEDDGHGMDPEKLKQKAIEKGLLSPEAAAGMSARQAFELIFLPGFSTAQQITDISGRGVGMDVVRTNISQLNGTIEIDSQPGQGTRMTIQLPMTLAVADGLLFEAGGETFAIPVDQVVEMVKIPHQQVRPALENELLYLRGAILPIFHLDRLLSLPATLEYGEEVYVLIVRGQGMSLGLLIDRPLGEQEIIVKPLHESLQALPGLSGATILGDGRVILILDADKLARAPGVAGRQ